MLRTSSTSSRETPWEPWSTSVLFADQLIYPPVPLSSHRSTTKSSSICNSTTITKTRWTRCSMSQCVPFPSSTSNQLLRSSTNAKKERRKRWERRDKRKTREDSARREEPPSERGRDSMTLRSRFSQLLSCQQVLRSIVQRQGYTMWETQMRLTMELFLSEDSLENLSSHSLASLITFWLHHKTKISSSPSRA